MSIIIFTVLIRGKNLEGLRKWDSFYSLGLDELDLSRINLIFNFSPSFSWNREKVALPLAGNFAQRKDTPKASDLQTCLLTPR